MRSFLRSNIMLLNFDLSGVRTFSNRSVCSALLVLLLSCVAVQAQSGSGGIQGTVQDSTGAVVGNAVVHVVNQATQVAVDTKSNGSGFYAVSSLFAGNYTLTFSAAGMKSYQVSLTLQVSQTAVINSVLTVGEANQTVTVEGNSIQLATYDSPTISSTLDNARLNELPVNGRFVLALAGLTTPGVEAGGTRANGNMGEALEYVEDGAPMTNRNFGGAGGSTQAQLPDPDFIQEVRLETLNSNAQFATPATGIITSKSGTNAYHGSLFETARNNGIGIAKARQDPANFKAPHYVRNEFGVSGGGPIIIPKLYNGRDKSFFFVAFERYSLRSFLSELVTVPMVPWRTGDFSNLVNGAGVVQKLYDPATTTGAGSQRTQFANNKIDPSRESPLAKQLMAITPLPSTNDNPYITPNLSVAGINNSTIPQWNFRLDHSINPSNKLFLRFTWIDQNQVALRNFPSNSAPTVAGAGFVAGASGLTQALVTSISAAVGYTHIFSPTFISESNIAQQWFQQNIVAGGAPNLNYESLMGLPNNFGQVGFPSIIGGTMPYGGTQYNYRENQIITNGDENLTKIWGKHQFQFGARYRHERFGYLPDRTADTINFSSQGTGLLDTTTGANFGQVSNTGNANADLFLGNASSYSLNLNAAFAHFRDQEFDMYFQDNIHLTKNLTINAGIRWEMHPAPQTHDGLTEGFDLANKAIVLPHPTSFYVDKGYTTQTIVTNMLNLGVKFETPAQAGLPEAMLYNYNRIFSPRLGVAYTPFNGRHGTVVRGGYGRYIYPVPIRSSLKIPAGNAPFTANYAQNYSSASQSPDGLPNYLLRAKQLVVAGVNSTGVVDSSNANSIQPGLWIASLDPHYAPASVQQFNTTIEQPLMFNSTLRVTYLYNHGSNLDQSFQYNNSTSPYVYEMVNGVIPPTGQYANTARGAYDQTTYGTGSQISQKTGWSNDNALQVNLQRLMKHGYGFQAYYVYSRAFRVGGNTTRDGVIYPAANFLPGTIPGGDMQTLNRFQNYRIDAAIPEHHIAFNGLVNLPFGKGKTFLRNSNRFVDALIGGFQVAGTGQVVSQWFTVASANWGPSTKTQVYKDSKPITDCRSGVCRKENLWFNGYIAPSSINASVNGVSGLPSDYVPYQTPINNTPGTANYGNNNVPVTLKNGTVVQVAYSPGPSGVNPFSKTILPGPMNYNADLSLFKVFTITESTNIRVNFDAFNAFNIQGNTNPNTTDGTQNFLTSYWSPRQLQVTARLSF
jgi:hypothetical protein